MDEKTPVSPAHSLDNQANVHVEVVDNADFAAAVKTANVKPWTPRMLQMYAICLLVTLNSCINGYDGSVMSGLMDVDPFREKMDNLSKTGGRTGFVFAIYTIGGLCGMLLAGPISDTWGRRWGMIFGAACIVIGSCVQATANGLGQYMGGRFILGFGVTSSSTAGPSYIVEFAHPVYRGTLTAIYNSFWFIGSIPAAWIVYGTNLHLKGTAASWRIPLWFQMTFSGIVLVGAFFIPESPRWLLSQNRHKEALALMTKYYGEGDSDNPIVQLTYKEMQEEISLTGSDKRWWDYSELGIVYLLSFGTRGKIPNIRGALWRLCMVTAMSLFGQFAGNAAVSYYLIVMLDQAGIKSTNTRLMLNGVITVLSFIGALIGSFVVDKVGRRPLLFGASCLFVLWFTLIAALSAEFVGTGNGAASNATVAMIYLFGFTFSIGFTPLQALYPVECLPFETRAKGMAFNALVVNLAGLFNQYVTPIGLGKAQWKYYFLYIAWDVFQAAFIYFFFVETKNRTLEELNVIFNAPSPRNESLKKVRVKVDDAHGVVTALDDDNDA